MRHGAITRENVTLEGPLIDYEDIKFDAQADSYQFYLMLQADQSKKEKVFTSAIHFYFDAIELTAIGLHSLMGYKYTLKGLKTQLWKMLERLAREVFVVDPELMQLKLSLFDVSSIKLDETKDSNGKLGLVRGLELMVEGKPHYICLPAHLITDQGNKRTLKPRSRVPAARRVAVKR